MIDMETSRSLVSFVGMRDPYPENDDEPGPLLSLLLVSHQEGRPFHEVWLLCTGGTFLERGRDLEREAFEEGLHTRFHLMDFAVADVIDYTEIWRLLQISLETITGDAGSIPRKWFFLLDSGTPQMKTALFLASRSRLFPATLLQGIPARFAGGTYKVREVCLEGIPEVQLPKGEPGTAAGAAPGAAGGVAGIAGCSPSSAGGDAEGGLVGSSPAFAAALGMAKRAAKYEDPVLIVGETGTGKTMIARSIHGESPRWRGPFVEVNCSAIHENLAESELFGHARGAFSGAEKARSGKFRAAHGGTLFLDEVGDLSPAVQSKLLKALEDKEVTPVGSDASVPADARVLTATNRNIPEMIRQGLFRRDLYERLKVVVIELPPLRERREDIRPLAARFLAAWNARYGETRFLTEDALLALESYSWPGNIRELDNAVKSAACFSASAAIGPESLPDEIRSALPTFAAGKTSAVSGGQDTPREALPANGSPWDVLSKPVRVPPEGINLRARLLQIEWEYVTEALRAAGGNRETAAKLLGMTGHAFRKALRERLAAFADEGWEEGM